MPARTIHTEEAVIKTATVEIKTLTLSGKQITLSVFRQLVREPLIDWETGQFRGLPWGTVNYHSGACAHGAHVHVIWQNGAGLRQDVLPQDLGSHVIRELRSRRRRLWDLMGFFGARWIEPQTAAGPISEVAYGQNPLTVPGYIQNWTPYESDDFRIIREYWKLLHKYRAERPAGELLLEVWSRGGTLKVDGDQLRFKCPAGALTDDQKGLLHSHRDALMELIKKNSWSLNIEYERCEKFKSRLGELAGECEEWMPKGEPMTRDSIQFVLDAVRVHRSALESAFAARWKELLALDQLFIAV